jgi:hypothetical protein
MIYKNCLIIAFFISLITSNSLFSSNRIHFNISKSVYADKGYSLALKELTYALIDQGYKIEGNDNLDKSGIQKQNIIVIENVNNNMGESFKIYSMQGVHRNIIRVEGGSNGLMYGIFKLAEEIRLGKNIVDIKLTMSPEFSRRMYAELGQLYDLPSPGYHLLKSPWVNNERLETEKKEIKLLIDHIAKMGFNTFTILHVNFEDYINYKYLEKEVYSKDDVHRIKAKQFAKHLTDIIHYAHDRHIKVFMQVYEFQYPPKLAALYDLDLNNPSMKEIIYAKINELFEAVPLDGLVITATESLPRSGYLSIEPWRKYGKAGAGKMMTIYHNAAKAIGKTLIFRSWMIAYGAEDSDKVIENTPQDAQFEIKHTGDDFWLNFPLTDAIISGLGKKRPLTITFDVFGQFYGWSRLLCYQQRIVQEAKIAKENGVIGIQAWGAWAPGCIWSDNHPGYLPNGQFKPHDQPYYDMAGPWNNFRIFTRGFSLGQMNAYAVSRVSWDVNLQPEKIASDWGTIHFGPKNSKAISDMLMNSEAAFRELYLSTNKREYSYHPVYFKWATTVRIDRNVLEKMYLKIPLSNILERNQIGYGYIKKMEEAFATIDTTNITSKEKYTMLKEGFEKTKLYLGMFYEFREMWWRERELKNINVKESFLKQKEYLKSEECFNEIMMKWQKYPEECNFWGLQKKYFIGENSFGPAQDLKKNY